MEVKNVKIGDIKPYGKNPRKNASAVDPVAASIKEFGFRVPIILDRDNVIVAGHTRLLAAKKLGMKEVPCVMAGDLTDEQVKGFRLAENKVSESASWDYNLLKNELFDIEFDMGDFGFDLDDIFREKVTDYKQTKNLDNLFKANFEASNDWGIPETEPFTGDLAGIEWISFGEKASVEDFSNIGIHFYIDDYKFESVWNAPDKHIEMFRKCRAVVTPDFSNYTDMPKAQQLWNQYRRQWLGKYWQDRGVSIVSSLSANGEELFPWALDGVPQQTTCAIAMFNMQNSDIDNADHIKAVIERVKPCALFIKSTDAVFEKVNLVIKALGIKSFQIPTFKFKGGTPETIQ